LLYSRYESAQKEDIGRLWAFLLPTDPKGGEELAVLLDKAKERLNRGRKPDEYVITKNRILFEAVKLGLPLVKKE
jgi:hypothetical protein